MLDGKNIMMCIEYTTKNVRKMKYYKLVYGDGTYAQLTQSLTGELYVEGVKIEEPEDIKELLATIGRSVTQSQLDHLLSATKKVK